MAVPGSRVRTLACHLAFLASVGVTATFAQQQCQQGVDGPGGCGAGAHADVGGGWFGQQRADADTAIAAINHGLYERSLDRAHDATGATRVSCGRGLHHAAAQCFLFTMHVC